MRNAVLLCLCVLPLLCGCTPAMRGGMALADGDYRPALRHYEEALAAHPDSLAIRRQIGITYFAMKDYARARQAFENALALAPRDPETTFYLGLSRIGKGEVAEGLGQLAVFDWPGKFARWKCVRDEAQLLLRYPGQPAEEIIRRMQNAFEAGRREQEILERELELGVIHSTNEPANTAPRLS